MVAAQQQARSCSASALKALEQSDTTAAQAGQLQHQLAQLLGRLKTGSTAKHSRTTTVKNPLSPTASTMDHAVKTNPQQATDPSVSATPAAAKATTQAAMTEPAKVESASSLHNPTADEQQLVAAEEAKMTNQLKRLGQLLDQPAEQPLADEAEQNDAEQAVTTPARAWIAGAGSTAEEDADSAQLLPKETAAPTVIRRRSRTGQRVVTPQKGVIPTLAENSFANGGQRPTISRKRLSIKAQR